jgi:enoyl-CoA hydratase/carnithine racemase
MSNPAVLYERDGDVCIITLNRPETRNALSEEVRTGIRNAFAEADSDSLAKVVILTARGKSFCAGADLKELARRNIHSTGRGFTPMLHRNMWIDKPVIAAVNGHALGGGFLQVQMCDLVVASTKASFGMPEARRGRGAPWSVPLLWMIPQRVWMELALTGSSIDAQRAYEIGLVNRVVEPDDLMSSALELATSVAKGAPLTVRATRQMVHLATEMGRAAAWDVADRLFAAVYASDDALEGPRAFAEGRKPSWS